jgi:hypothetical protein
MGTVSPAVSDTVEGLTVTTFTAGNTLGRANLAAPAPRVTGTARVEIVHFYDIYLPVVLRNP